MFELRFDVQKTNNGFMIHDIMTEDYLHDDNGDNCFDTFEEISKVMLKYDPTGSYCFQFTAQ